MDTVTFQEGCAVGLNNLFPVKGRVVLELASDKELLAAKRFAALGATKVIASNVYPSWSTTTASGVEIAVLDARAIDLHLEPNSIDIVSGINLLEHLPELARTLDAIHYVLRPGGICYLHGHPLWTSARGHHMLFSFDGQSYRFGDKTNPIPPWAHLFMEEQQLESVLSNEGYSKKVVENALDWVFFTNRINRSTRIGIDYAFRNCKMNVLHVFSNHGEIPDASIIEKIRGSRWWDANEDYGVRQITYILRKASL